MGTDKYIKQYRNWQQNEKVEKTFLLFSVLRFVLTSAAVEILMIWMRQNICNYVFSKKLLPTNNWID